MKNEEIIKNVQKGAQKQYCHLIIQRKCIHLKQSQAGHLYLGGVESLKKGNLSKYQISCVLTIMNDWSYKYNNVELKIKSYNSLKQHKWIDLHDHQEESIYQHFQQCIEFIKEKLLEGNNVLVHCLMGASRSASIVLAYLMKQHNMTLNQAFSHTKNIRDIIEPNQSFWKDLVRYEAELQQKKLGSLEQLQQQLSKESKL